MTSRFDALAMVLSKKSLDFELALADGSRLIPVYLGTHDLTAAQVYVCESLAFSPASAPVTLAKPRKLPDSGAGSDGLCIDYCAHDFEFMNACLQSPPGRQSQESSVFM